MKDIHDVIKYAKFGDDRLRGSGVVAGQISAFPIDSAGRPYNTLTLPCERVICTRDIVWHRTRSTSNSESAMSFAERLYVLRLLSSCSNNLSVSPARLRLNNIILTRVTLANVCQHSASVSDSNCACHFLLSAAMY